MGKAVHIYLHFNLLKYDEISQETMKPVTRASSVCHIIIILWNIVRFTWCSDKSTGGKVTRRAPALHRTEHMYASYSPLWFVVSPDVQNHDFRDKVFRGRRIMVWHPPLFTSLYLQEAVKSRSAESQWSSAAVRASECAFGRLHSFSPSHHKLETLSFPCIYAESPW